MGSAKSKNRDDETLINYSYFRQTTNYAEQCEAYENFSQRTKSIEMSTAEVTDNIAKRVHGKSNE